MIATIALLATLLPGGTKFLFSGVISATKFTIYRCNCLLFVSVIPGIPIIVLLSNRFQITSSVFMNFINIMYSVIATRNVLKMQCCGFATATQINTLLEI
jgi:hypothetical protein